MSARTVVVRVALIALAAAAAVWAAFGLRAVYVGGGSMSPALAKGDLVVLRRGADRVREGDVVLVEKTGWPSGILHRVHAVNADDTLVLQGDANPTADRDPVRFDAVLGVAVWVVPTGWVLAAVESVGR